MPPENKPNTKQAEKTGRKIYDDILSARLMAWEGMHALEYAKRKIMRSTMIQLIEENKDENTHRHK